MDKDESMLSSKEKSLKSVCPGFKKNFDPNALECEGCAKKFSEEYRICEKVCRSEEKSEPEAPPAEKKAPEVKEKPKKKEKPKAKPSGGKNKYGHRMGAQPAFLDEVLEQAVTVEEVVEAAKAGGFEKMNPPTVKWHIKMFKVEGYKIIETDGRFQIVPEERK